MSFGHSRRDTLTVRSHCQSSSLPFLCPGDSKDGNGTSPDKITIGPGGIPHKAISPIKGPSKQAASLHSGQYPTYQTIDPTLVNPNDMDIFRVERLWVNEAGHKFAFGFHYLRPHETFHEPSRRFFDNEVFRVPIYEVLPLDTIWAECWVTDPVTFCRGRALAAKEEDVYICEYRVDKTARLFNKISKAKYPTCTKSYAFHNFDLRLKVTRSYTVSQTFFICLFICFNFLHVLSKSFSSFSTC